MTVINGNNNNNNNNMNNNGQFGDTTYTKVFVGGLAWETPKEVMKEHFEKYGEILEAVIISDKITGRSKGYGFVTFKEPEAAKKACEDPTPIINGRRANCNLAALGARRPPRSLSATPPLQQHQPAANGGNVNVMRSPSPGAPAAAPPSGHMQWYYPAPGAAPVPATINAHHHQAVPFYGYAPAAYVAPDVGYNQKMSYNGGAYMNGAYYAQGYPGNQAMMGANTLMPMYPAFYHYHQQSQHQHHHHPQAAAMGLPTHIYPPTSAATISAPPTIISKPTPVSISSPSGTF